MWTGAKPTEIEVLVSGDADPRGVCLVPMCVCPSHCNPPPRGNLLVGRRVVEAVALVLARAGVALPHRGLAVRARHVAAVGLAGANKHFSRNGGQATPCLNENDIDEGSTITQHQS